MPTLYPFNGVIQHYAWGGYAYLPDLLQQPNPEHEPWAELWMGAHAKGPGRLNNGDGTLAELIDKDPQRVLGSQVADRFDNRLPFLFKVLDVRQMLSIQVHPTKAAAEEGFAKEEENGPARDAPDRNYRDDNHKPELGVALTDFYLLHGFRSVASIRDTLMTTPGWDALVAVLDDKGPKGLYAYVMDADQSTVDELLQPLVDTLTGSDYTRDDVRFWAQRAVEQYTTEDGHHDRGIFSIYWFNLVHLHPGEGIFQDAGIPHAYLEGVCIELMANSDNVLRGGLTPKHIDVPELLEKTRFEPVTPNVLTVASADGWVRYPTPAPDFALEVATLGKGESLEVSTNKGAAILLLLSGSVNLSGQPVDESARTVFIPADEDLTLRATAEARVYLATVGQ